MGVFAFSESSVHDIYVIPGSIKQRGDMRRYQMHDVYRQDQTDAFEKFKYRQTISYWTANCREGKSDVQKSEYFDSQGAKLSESIWRLDLKTPDPGSLNEKTLDFVCDYKI